MSYTTAKIQTRDETATTPQSTIVHHSGAGKPSINATQTLGTFTGEVWLDPVLMQAGIDMSIATVNFSPKARTNWHKHERGQCLRVLAGSGWVCDQGGKPRRIAVGDVVWCPAGGVHWHGADDERFMVHEALSLGGIEWYEEVGDEVYRNKNGT